MEKGNGYSLTDALRHMSPANRFFIFVLFFCFVITFPTAIAVINPFLLSERAMAKGLVLFLCLIGSLILYFMTFKHVAWAATKNDKVQNLMYLLALVYFIVFGVYAYATVLVGKIDFFTYKSSLLHLFVAGLICAIVTYRTSTLVNNNL